MNAACTEKPSVIGKCPAWKYLKLSKNRDLLLIESDSLTYLNLINHVQKHSSEAGFTFIFTYIEKLRFILLAMYEILAVRPISEADVSVIVKAAKDAKIPISIRRSLMSSLELLYLLLFSPVVILIFLFSPFVVVFVIVFPCCCCICNCFSLFLLSFLLL